MLNKHTKKMHRNMLPKDWAKPQFGSGGKKSEQIACPKNCTRKIQGLWLYRLDEASGRWLASDFRQTVFLSGGGGCVLITDSVEVSLQAWCSQGGGRIGLLVFRTTR